MTTELLSIQSVLRSRSDPTIFCASMAFQMSSLQQFDNVNGYALWTVYTVTQSNGTSLPLFSFKNKLTITGCLK